MYIYKSGHCVIHLKLNLIIFPLKNNISVLYEFSILNSFLFGSLVYISIFFFSSGIRVHYQYLLRMPLTAFFITTNSLPFPKTVRSITPSTACFLRFLCLETSSFLAMSSLPFICVPLHYLTPPPISLRAKTMSYFYFPHIFQCLWLN